MHYLLFIYAAQFLSVMNSTSIKILLPAIMLDLGVQMNWLTWAVNSFTLPFAILLPVCGYIGDRRGPFRFYIWGLAILSAGSLLCGLAPSFAALVGGRITQALGAALLVPNSLTLLLWLTPGEKRSRTLGLWGTVAALGSITGPVLTGFLVGYFPWRSSFYLVFALCLLILLLSGRISGSLRLSAADQSTRRFDYLGALLLFAAISGILFVITLLPDLGWNHRWIQLLLVSSALLVYLFVQVEKTTAGPMIDLGLIRRPLFYLGLTVGWLEQVALAGTMFALPLYFTLILGIDAAKTAVLLTPTAIAFAIASPLGGKVVDRVGFGIPISLGMFVRMCSFLLLFYITAHYGSIWAIIATLFLSGFGHGLTNIPAMYAVLSTVDKDNYGLAGGIHNMFRYTGSVAGTSISGIIIYALAAQPAALGLSGSAPEFAAAFLFCAGTCLLGTGIGLLFFKKTARSSRSAWSYPEKS